MDLLPSLIVLAVIVGGFFLVSRVRYEMAKRARADQTPDIAALRRSLAVADNDEIGRRLSAALPPWPIAITLIRCVQQARAVRQALPLARGFGVDRRVAVMITDRLDALEDAVWRDIAGVLATAAQDASWEDVAEVAAARHDAVQLAVEALTDLRKAIARVTAPQDDHTGGVVRELNALSAALSELRRVR